MKSPSQSPPRWRTHSDTDAAIIFLDFNTGKCGRLHYERHSAALTGTCV